MQTVMAASPVRLWSGNRCMYIACWPLGIMLPFLVKYIIWSDTEYIFICKPYLTNVIVSMQLTGKRQNVLCVYVCMWDNDTTQHQNRAASFSVSTPVRLQRNATSRPEAVALTTAPAVQPKTYLTNLFGSHISYLITWSTCLEELLRSSRQSLIEMNWAIT